jgi:outer membrane immunogenic protein
VTKRITSFFALTTFVLAVSGSAFAADIAVKAPLPAPAPVYDWTGWYAGVNAGASFGRVKTDFNVAPAFLGPVQVTPDFAFSDTEHPSGFIGGGQIGYNWRYSPLIVVGLEADIQGALERQTNNFSQNFIFSSSILAEVGSAGTVTTNYTTQIDWFGTVRGRLGYVWGNGQLLSYVTGGLAYGEVKINGTTTVNGTTGVFGGPFQASGSISFPQTFGHSQVNTGWVVGYGTEGVINFWGARNWTWKVEGLYMDLGTLDTTGVSTGASFSGAGACTSTCTPTGGLVHTHSHFTDGILRAGLNYKFN